MSSHTIADRSSATGAVANTQTVGKLGGIGIAALRIALGFVFLWAFLDKTFGLGYSTAAERSWLSGGSPTNGFLSRVEVGPLQSLFNAIAGTWWADLLFMVGLLTIGVALIAGVALRLAAAAASLMMVLMWAAEWPLAQFTSTGAANGSSNPFVDYHLIYALSAIVLAVIGAGSCFGLAKWWAGITKGNAVLR
jgi:thiosulfate dehydrogenase [quinone] large subunit